jgi:hypothetical protein
MKIIIDGRNYWIYFRRIMFSSKSGNKNLIKTICIIKGFSSFDGEISGVATQNYADPNNNIVARKVALRKALEPLEKVFRTKVWQEYAKQARLVPGKILPKKDTRYVVIKGSKIPYFSNPYKGRVFKVLSQNSDSYALEQIHPGGRDGSADQIWRYSISADEYEIKEIPNEHAEALIEKTVPF